MTDSIQQSPPREAVLDIEGMTCTSCVARVEKRLQGLDGVSAAVNLATESARVTYPAHLDSARLIEAVRSAGYDARLRERPSSGARQNENRDLAVNGQRDHSHHGRSQHDSAHHDSAHDGSAHDGSAHHDSAHDGSAHESAGHVHDVEDAAGATPLRTRLITSAALAAPVVALGMIPAWQFPGWQWVSFVLATPVVLWGGWPFHRATIANARHGAATMDTLITLGTMAAYLWSMWALFFGSAGRIGAMHEVALFGPVSDATALVYFEVAAAVTVLLLLGRFVEQRSKKRAGSALRSLMELGAKDVELADGGTIPIAELNVGDVFIARPGTTIATDGVVVDGAASVDESMLTGESVPVEVAEGVTVTGGTIAADGRLAIRATSIGADTRLAHIARLVEDAQLGKSRVQRLADRISGVFVPIVIALAAATLLGWLIAGQPVAAGFTAAVSVLIIACPCALGLATPIAILVGTGRGAQLGILITGPAALESAERIDTVVFDKTGTLTEGRMSVASVHVGDGVDADEATRLVGSLEALSEHPVARAVAASAQSHTSVDEFRSHAGRGVTGVVDGRRAFAGRASFAVEQGVILPALLAAAARDGEQRGTVVVGGWAEPGQPLVARIVFVLTDSVRAESSNVVAVLRSTGLEVMLLTGDNSEVAQRVAGEVGIERVIAGVHPEDKVTEIERLRSGGHRVAMVGDGVNDAAALATADLGIAMGNGTDAAMHASDITLIRSGLSAVATALQLSRRTMRVIRGNLFWAFAYNVAALPLAALGLLNPMIAGAAMAFSSVFVVLNSLRLRGAP